MKIPQRKQEDRQRGRTAEQRQELRHERARAGAQGARANFRLENNPRDQRLEPLHSRNSQRARAPVRALSARRRLRQTPQRARLSTNNQVGFCEDRVMDQSDSMMEMQRKSHEDTEKKKFSCVLFGIKTIRHKELVQTLTFRSTRTWLPETHKEEQNKSGIIILEFFCSGLIFHLYPLR